MDLNELILENPTRIGSFLVVQYENECVIGAEKERERESGSDEGEIVEIAINGKGEINSIINY